jgi:hypothetical protein
VIVQEPDDGVGVALIPLMFEGTVSTICTFAADDGPWLLLLTVHWMGEPATTGEVFSVLVFTRAAEVVTVPGAVADGLVPGVADETVAVFATELPFALDALTVPEIFTVAVAASAIVGKVHVTVWPDMEQLPVPALTAAAVGVTPVGTTSVMTTA